MRAVSRSPRIVARIREWYRLVRPSPPRPSPWVEDDLSEWNGPEHGCWGDRVLAARPLRTVKKD